MGAISDHMTSEPLIMKQIFNSALIQKFQKQKFIQSLEKMPVNTHALPRLYTTALWQTYANYYCGGTKLHMDHS